MHRIAPRQKGHGVDSEGDSRIAFLDFQVSIFMHANSLGHHANGQGSLTSRYGNVSAELGNGLPQAERQNCFVFRRFHKVS